LQEKLVAYSGEQSAETEQAFQIFVRSIEESENALKTLKESDAQITQISNSLEILQSAAANFKAPSSEAQIAQNILVAQNTLIEGEAEIYAIESAVEFVD
jgi:hypothetical protein